MHPPFTQCWPAAQAAPAPHAQPPAAVQASLRIASQAVHAWPEAPHCTSERATHAAPTAQQPEGQDVASHTQAPDRQRCPAPQAAPVPQAHAPAGEQPSALVTSQLMHSAPAAPQLETLGGLQVAPAQQPSGQLTLLQPLQRPSVQVCPAGQASQAFPPTPHDAGVLPATHAPPAQQPSGHEVASHTQVLPMQRWPAAHTAPTPQRQTPADEQLSACWSQTVQVAPPAPHDPSERVAQVSPWQHPLGHDAASQVHRPPTQRWPPAQAGPVPQAQAPLVEQPSVRPWSQAAHSEPATPQVSCDWLVHTLPRQQPPGQEAASHTQTPFMQRCPATHGGPPPQRQAPVSEQLSALLVSQPTQAAPAAPQACTDRG